MSRSSCSFFRGALIALAGTVIFGASAPGARPKPALATPPPQAVEQTLQVRRSDTIDIPLRIYGTRAQTLQFRIRSAPRSGKLSAVRQITPERAAVTYTPPADRSVGHDQFSYAVRSKEGVSAAAQVTIRILDEPAKLVVPAEIVFPPHILGGDASAQLSIANAGGTMTEGTIEVDPPWRIEEKRAYRLSPDEQTTLQLLFRPERPGDFRGEIRFSSEPLHPTILRGTARAPITFDTTTIELRQAPEEPVRTASFAATNHSDAPVTLAFVGHARLQFARELTLSPRETRRVTIALAEDDAASFSGTIRAEPHGAISVEAEALPARLTAQEPAPSTAQIPPIPAAVRPRRGAPLVQVNAPASQTAARARPPPDEGDRLFPPRVYPRELGQGKAVIEWGADLSSATQFRAQEQRVAVRDQKVQIEWHEYAAFRTERQGKKIVGTFSNLQPGRVYVMRVLPINAGDPSRVPAPLVEVRFATAPPPKRAFKITPVRVLLVVLAIVGAIAVRQRIKRP